MPRDRRRPQLGWLIALAVALLAAPVRGDLDEPAGALGSRSFGGTTHVVMIPAAAFSTQGNAADSTELDWVFGRLSGTGAGGGCVQAPVYLPHASRVTELWASVIDDDGSSNVSISLHRTSTVALGDTSQMASVSTTGASSAIVKPSDLTIDDADVVLPDYAYYVTTCLGSADHHLYSVRVWYQPRLIFRDGFESGGTSGWTEEFPASGSLAVDPPYGSPLVIPASAFRSDGVNPDELFLIYWQDQLQGQQNEPAYAVAPVYLPSGATVTFLQAMAHDGFDGSTGPCGSSKDVGVWLFRVSNDTGEAQQMSFLTTSGGSGLQFPFDDEVENATISYPAWSAYAVVRLCHTAHLFHGLQVFYGE